MIIMKMIVVIEVKEITVRLREKEKKGEGKK